MGLDEPHLPCGCPTIITLSLCKIYWLTFCKWSNGLKNPTNALTLHFVYFFVQNPCFPESSLLTSACFAARRGGLEPVAPVTYEVILEPGIGQFREFESPEYILV